MLAPQQHRRQGAGKRRQQRQRGQGRTVLPAARASVERQARGERAERRRQRAGGRAPAEVARAEGARNQIAHPCRPCVVSRDSERGAGDGAGDEDGLPRAS
jgi:hypothetical protein